MVWPDKGHIIRLARDAYVLKPLQQQEKRTPSVYHGLLPQIITLQVTRHGQDIHFHAALNKLNTSYISCYKIIYTILALWFSWTKHNLVEKYSICSYSTQWKGPGLDFGIRHLIKHEAPNITVNFQRHLSLIWSNMATSTTMTNLHFQLLHQWPKLQPLRIQVPQFHRLEKKKNVRMRQLSWPLFSPQASNEQQAERCLKWIKY